MNTVHDHSPLFNFHTAYLHSPPRFHPKLFPPLSTGSCVLKSSLHVVCIGLYILNQAMYMVHRNVSSSPTRDQAAVQTFSASSLKFATQQTWPHPAAHE
jgi:hypothetical protein